MFEEKLARDVYLMLYEQWARPIFSNIAESEQRHMDAIETMLDRYAIPDPVIDEETIGACSNPELRTLYEQLITDGGESLSRALDVGDVSAPTASVGDTDHAVQTRQGSQERP